MCSMGKLASCPSWLKWQSGCLNSAFPIHFYTFYGSSVQFMDTQLDALPALPVLARGVSGCVNSAFLDISRQFTAHLFSPGIPSSARGKGGGPLAPLSGNPGGKVACWDESSHNPEVWSLTDLLSDEHRTCSTPSWWQRILTTPSSEWEGRSSGSSGKGGSSESST